MKPCRACGSESNQFEPGRRVCVVCRRARRKTFGTRSGDGLRRKNLMYFYGLTLEKYNEMLTAQNGVCKICSCKDDSRWGVLSVDHCHSTGKVRGLLCAKCNKGLGQFKDNVELLDKAKSYLLVSR